MLAGLVAIGLAPREAWGAVLATDTFVDANGTALTTHSANWTYAATSAGFFIQSNAVAPDGSTANGFSARYTGVAWPDNQYSQGTIVAISAGDTHQLGPAVRIQASATRNDKYEYIARNRGTIRQFAKVVNDVLTSWGTVTADTLNHTLYISADGSTIRAKYDGVDDTGLTTNPATDTAWTSGDAGIHGFKSGTLLRMTPWEGGSIEPPPALTPGSRMLLGVGM
jgi:hypothetical protein